MYLVDNKRAVWLVGTVSAEDLPALQGLVRTGRNYIGFHALCHYGPSLDGLNDWPAQAMDAVGNLAAHGYTVEEIAEVLLWAAAAAPSLALKVHCGGDYEDAGVVATITVAGLEVTIGPPEVPRLRPTSDDERVDRVVHALLDA
jgi:hypothetical protein